MVKLIEEANSNRSRSEILVERFAKVYTPVIISLAFFTAAIPLVLWAVGSMDATCTKEATCIMSKEEALRYVYVALVLLVVSCPCALVISTPVTYVSTLSTAATHNIVIRGGEYLESLGRIKTICLDKTGTLTEGRFVVREVVVDSSGASPLLDLKTCLGFMHAVEKKSMHPSRSPSWPTPARREPARAVRHSTFRRRQARAWRRP